MKVAGIAEQWFIFEILLIEWQQQLKVAGSAEQWCMVFEVLSFDGSRN